MNIDFSGGGTQTTQNLHQLWWDGPTQALIYAASTPLFRIQDTGVIQIVPPPVAADDAAAAALGLPVGALYRTGSTLKVRAA
jgi:hypothetical protein